MVFVYTPFPIAIHTTMVEHPSMTTSMTPSVKVSLWLAPVILLIIFVVLLVVIAFIIGCYITKRRCPSAEVSNYGDWDSLYSV